MNNRSIAFITHKFPPGPGGMERWNLQMAEAYGKASVQVSVVHFRVGKEPLFSEHFSYFPVTVDPSDSPYRSPRFSYTIGSAARIAFGFLRSLPLLRRHALWQVTFGEGLLLKVFVYAAAFVLRKRVIAASGCVMFAHPYRSFWGALIKKSIMRLMLNRSETILVDGTDLRSELVENGIRGRKIQVCYAGIDTEMFKNSGSSGLSDLLERKNAHLEPDRKTILYSCRLSAENAPLDFIHVLERLPEHSHLQGLVIGDGPLREEMVSAAQKLSHPVTFLGSVEYEELPAVLSGVDICLFTYSRHIGGISQMIPLSMSCETVVVTTRVGDNEALVDHETNGFLADPGDILALTAIITRILTTTAEDLSVLRQKARATIQAHWTLSRRAQMYGEMVSRVLT